LPDATDGERSGARLARALPWLVAATTSFFWLQEKGIGARLLLAGVAGAVIYAGGLFALLLCTYVIARLAGKDATSIELAKNDLRLTVFLLVFACTYALGHYWVSSTVRQIVRCVEDSGPRGAYAQFSPARNLDGHAIRYCSSSYSDDAGRSSDD